MRVDGGWKINGQKVDVGAHYAQRGLATVRTDFDAPNAGITTVMIDMNAPGSRCARCG